MTSNPLADAIERGIDFHKARELDQALAWYRAALAIGPDDAEANSLLGLALVHAGRGDEGVAYLRRATELEPGQVSFRFNLVQGLRATGAYDGAMSELGAILAREPDNLRAWERAGDVARRQQDDEGAARAWERALALDPSAVALALKLAGLQIERGRFDAVLAALNPIADRAAEDETIYTLWCRALTGLGDWQALRKTAGSWAAGNPKATGAWRHLARANLELGRYREGIDTYYQLLTRNGPSVGDLTAYAGLCQLALQFETAEAALKRAVALDPANADTLTNLAQVRMYRGRFAEAEEYCRKALATDRRHVPAYAVLGALRSGALDNAELEAVSALADDPEVALDRRVAAAFVRGHACDARSDTDSAFPAYTAAHELARQRDTVERRSYDPAQDEAYERRLIELCPAERPQAVPARTGTRPVFIVGMPRSGTTLVEAVLGVHSRVFACGERASMREIVRAFREMTARGTAPDDRLLADWARAYLEDLPALGGADHVTDKHPLNLDAVGLIMRLFPTALVLHVRRDPLETCLSVYRQPLSRLWTFAHRLPDIAHYYRRGERLAAHWAQAFPKRFLTVQYEAFVRDFADAAPALVEACGLAWEPQCLTFQRSPRPIATLSAVQIRGPVADGNGRAARYAAHLGPLTAALDVSDRPTGI